MDIRTEEIERLRSRIEELEAALRTSEGHLLDAVEAESRRARDERDAFFASLQDGFETLDAEGRILDVNQRFAEIVGRPREEIVGLRPPFPWWPPDGPQREAVQGALHDVIRGGSGEFDLTFVRPDGRTVDVILNANAVRAPDGGTMGVVASVKDVSDRVAEQVEREELLHRLAEERMRLAAAVRRLSRLQRFTASISLRLREDEVLGSLLSAARDAVGASGAAVAIEHEGTLARVGVSGGTDPDMVPEQTGIDDEGPLADAFRTGRSLWIDPRPGGKEEQASERWAFVPLVVREGSMGVLALCGPEDAYSDEDRSLLETMVWQAGQALERARLVDSEQRGRERLARVLAVSDAALGWLDSEEALAALLRRIREAVGADSASLLVREGDVLRVRATDGLERVPEEQVPIPIGQGFSGRIAHERTPLVVEDLPTFQVVSPWLRERLRSVVGVPILRGDDVLGVLHAGSATPRSFDADDVELLTLVAARVGGALERAQLFEWARTARADASRAANRLSRLQTATGALTGAVTVDEVSEAILHEAIAAVHADAGVLAVPSADGASLDIVAVRGRQPTDRPFPASFPIDADVTICAAFRSGEVVWVPSREEWERRYPDGLGITKPWARSILAVPMRLEGDRNLGSIGLMFKTEGRLSKDERRLARAFADQGALALERARLFEAERTARDATERLQTFAVSLAAAATTREVLSILVEEGGDIVGASFAWAAIVDTGAQELDAVVSRGYPDEVIEPFRRMSLDTSIPACDAVRGSTGAVVRHDGSVPACLPGLRGARDRARRRVRVRADVRRGRDRDRRRVVPVRAAHRAQRTPPRRRPRDRRPGGAGAGARAALRAGATGRRYAPAQPAAVGAAPGSPHRGRGPLPAGHAGARRRRGLVRRHHDRRAPVGPGGRRRRGARHRGRERDGSVAERAPRARPGIERAGVGGGEARPDRSLHDAGHARDDRVCRGGPRSRRAALRLRRSPAPVMLVGEDARLLEDGRTTPLAALPEPAPFEEGREAFGPGAVLVLYSDGLIERRGEPLDVGMGRLRAQLAVAERRDPEELADAVMTGLIGEIPQDDDVAILCVRAAPTIGPFASSVPADPKALGGLRDELRAWLRDAAVPRDVRDDVVLACNEACANAVEHASLTVAGEPIAVRLRRADSTLLLEVADVGAWREGGADGDRGRGLEIMRAVMDDVELTSSPTGTVVRMRRRLDGAAGTEEVSVKDERPTYTREAHGSRRPRHRAPERRPPTSISRCRSDASAPGPSWRSRGSSTSIRRPSSARRS